ncbi:MAG: phosphoglucosamine mutase [Acidobacteria bacterium]|nr:phosphoglucosamine mutase [Acidobacteriota bacterium]
MTHRLFGTDGIRARFGDEPLREASVRRIGSALARRLAAGAVEPRVLIAGDTRGSREALTAWLATGLARGGARPVDLGVLPTPALARLVVARGAAAGVAISASHNPAEDNGLKLIGPDGFKWSELAELDLEREIEATPAVEGTERRAPVEAGAAEEYLAATLSRLGGGRPLDGQRVALDLAHGAAVPVARALFERLGANVTTFADRPDGRNINADCGSTHPEALAVAMRDGGYDLGFSFDGDADRALLVDERGEVRDGDAMLVLWAGDLARRGRLSPSEIVATSMSNLGLERALAALSVGVVRCGVGDREVVATLRERGLRLGGEQSGHLVDLELSTTGDGLLTAAHLASVVAASGRSASELLAGFRRFPQLLRNVRVRTKPPLESLAEVTRVARDVERRLGDEGRLVLRYSGTEPLARIMLEGPDEPLIDALADDLERALRAEIGSA